MATASKTVARKRAGAGKDGASAQAAGKSTGKATGTVAHTTQTKTGTARVTNGAAGPATAAPSARKTPARVEAIEPVGEGGERTRESACDQWSGGACEQCAELCASACSQECHA